MNDNPGLEFIKDMARLSLGILLTSIGFVYSLVPLALLVGVVYLASTALK